MLGVLQADIFLAEKGPGYGAVGIDTESEA